MKVDDRQVTTVFTVHYHEALPSSANDEVKSDCTFADDGNAS